MKTQAMQTGWAETVLLADHPLVQAAQAALTEGAADLAAAEREAADDAALVEAAHTALAEARTRLALKEVAPEEVERAKRALAEAEARAQEAEADLDSRRRAIPIFEARLLEARERAWPEVERAIQGRLTEAVVGLSAALVQAAGGNDEVIRAYALYEANGRRAPHEPPAWRQLTHLQEGPLRHPRLVLDRDPSGQSKLVFTLGLYRSWGYEVPDLPLVPLRDLTHGRVR